MSGPIVRKYGFPNFEQIFGKRELEHGVDEDEAPAASSETAAQGEAAAAEETGKAKPASKKKSRGK